MSERVSDTRLAELRAVAEAATPGPWEADGQEVTQHWSRPEPWTTIASSEVVCMSYCYGGSARGIERDEDADHIAAFDPPTVLALLSEIAELRDRETRIHHVLSGVPECDIYKPGDVISCGWKRDLLTIRNIVEGADCE